MKAKYKLDTMVEVAGKGFLKIDGVVLTSKGTEYLADDGLRFAEDQVLSAYRPVKTRLPKVTKKTKKVARQQEEAVN